MAKLDMPDARATWTDSVLRLHERIVRQTDASHCVPREASVFSYGISEMTIKKGSQFPTLSLQTDGFFHDLRDHA